MENEPAPVDPVLLTLAEEEPPRRGNSDWSPAPFPLGKLIATHNPLYAVSAALVFYGLRISFDASGATHSAVLMACLIAYVLLLSGTAVWLRRLGTLWEDVRMLALLVLLLLLGLSVTFDATLVEHRNLGTAYFLGGWWFAAVVCEALLLGLQVRLPAIYRLPFHALLALIFLYPLGAVRYASPGDEMKLGWYLLAFPLAAALILLTLLPAVWRGPRVVADNGTPWRWPLYPLTLFMFLTVGVVGRSYYLCYSFSSAPDGETIYGVYFLIPLSWAVGLLALVGTARHATPAVAMRMLVLPLGWLTLANTASMKLAYDPTHSRFLHEWTTMLGCGPAAIAVLLTVAYFAAAWALRVPCAFGSLIASLTLASVVHGPARAVNDWQTAHWAPYAVAMLLVWAEGLRRREVWRCVVGALMVTLGVAVWAARRGNVPIEFTTYHAALASLALVGVIFHGAKGRYVREVVFGMLFLAGSNAVLSPYGGLFTDVPAWSTYYPWLAIALVVVAGYVFREAVGYVIGVVLLVEWLGLRGWHEYVRLRRYVSGLDAIALGMLAFAAAVGVSLSKARRSAASNAADEPPSPAVETAKPPN